MNTDDKRGFAASASGARKLEIERKPGGHFCAAVDDPELEADYGAAIDEVYEDSDGRFWATNGEYSSAVAFCPFCGSKAPRSRRT